MSPYEFALAKVTEAGAMALRAQEVGLRSSIKGGDPKDIVTNADTEISEFLLQEIKITFPDHGVHSEEGGGFGVDREMMWAIDPIDGSANFSRGVPHFSTCVGLLKAGVPVVGAVYNPVTKELFSFEKGKGAFLNGSFIHVSDRESLSEAHVLFHAGRSKELCDWGGESYRRLLGGAQKTKNLGSSALDLCFLAAGRVEAYVAGTLSTFDIAGAIGILSEAGGVIADAQGGTVGFSRKPQKIYAANSDALLREIRALLES